jgi:hypothetical protein
VLTAARAGTRERVEATRSLAPGDFRCPECGWGVVLKPGRVKVAHFAHRPGAPACDAEGESLRHMAAKAVLARRFRGLGYDVVIEESHPDLRRRIDVAVTLVGAAGQPVRLAVEIQDSAIAVGEVKRRTAADKTAGFFATVWVFTTNRLARVASALPGDELRLPEEMRYLVNRWRLPVAILDVDRERILLVGTGDVVRDGSSWFTADGDEEYSDPRRLRSTRRVEVAAGEFRLTAAHGRYATHVRPDYTAVFAPAPVPPCPWRLSAVRPATTAVIDCINLPEPPTHGLGHARAVAHVDAGLVTRLEHLPTGRAWHLTRAGRTIDGAPRHVWTPSPDASARG